MHWVHGNYSYNFVDAVGGIAQPWWAIVDDAGTGEMTTMPGDSREKGEELQDEFLRLFSTYSRRIYGFILTLVMRRVDAEEIFQDTCLILWKKFDSYDPQGSFYGWACRIAYLEVLQRRRKNKRLQLISEEMLASLADKALSHASRLGLLQDALEECMQKLKMRDRALIEERYHQARTPREIAEKSARSVYSVYRALARVHTTLLNCVQGRLARDGGVG